MEILANDPDVMDDKLIIYEIIENNESPCQTSLQSHNYKPLGWIDGYPRLTQGHHRPVDGYHRLPQASQSSQNLKYGSVNNRLNRDETLIDETIVAGLGVSTYLVCVLMKVSNCRVW